MLGSTLGMAARREGPSRRGLGEAEEHGAQRVDAKHVVLLVEDDAEIRTTLESLLADEGYEVIASPNGLKALERLDRGARPDVILLDLMMPLMDGWEFRVRQKKDARFADIPVIAISADATPKAAAIDADTYLAKPFAYAALVGAIERTIRGRDRCRLSAIQTETERLASLGRLAAGLAHEIDDPLASVMANLEVAFELRAAADAPRREEERAAVDEARRGCARIRTIVRDLQLFARPDDDTTALVDVRGLLDACVTVLEGDIRRRARLVKVYEDVPLVEVNAARLAQALLNLLTNAAQAIAEGEPETQEIRLVARRVGEHALEIEIRDTGTGIAPENQARVFEPFFTTKPPGTGTGLGLSMAHRFVTAMHGEIAFQSEPGKGTSFRVRLPGARADA